MQTQPDSGRGRSWMAQTRAVSIFDKEMDTQLTSLLTISLGGIAHCSDMFNGDDDDDDDDNSDNEKK